MLKRILFTLSQMKPYKKTLKGLLNDHDFAVDNVLSLDLDRLKQKGISVIVLDFDGVLAAHGAAEPLNSVKLWLNKLTATFGEDHIYILSNKPTAERLHYFKAHFPLFQFIQGVAKKPYPEGLLKVIELSKHRSDQIALVDDRLLTGCLAALIAKVQPIYIKKAWRNFKKRPIVEGFFAFLRWFERFWV